MSRKEILINAKGNTSVLWKLYVDKRKYIKRHDLSFEYLCFYEGQDDCKYYNIKLKELGKSVTHFDCKGKYKLLTFRNFMLKKYKSEDMEDILYFIDKDYDNIINPHLYSQFTQENDIYITPCYSIENFYTTEEVFSDLIIHEYAYDISSNEYQELMTVFSTLKSQFNNYIQEVNTWYATYKYYFDSAQITDEISLNDFKLNKYITLDLSDISTPNLIINPSKNILIDLEKKLSNKPNDFEQTLHKFNLLINKPCDFRGKNELFFLIKLIEVIINTKKYTNFNIFGNNVISNIVQYTIRPECLDQFIDSQS